MKERKRERVDRNMGEPVLYSGSKGLFSSGGCSFLDLSICSLFLYDSHDTDVLMCPCTYLSSE